jgi:cyclophilin family peptidyl-prolyl cis-trans isomerase
MRKRSKKILAITAVIIASFTSLSNATIVQIQTSYGNIEVNLFDTSTPKTVANFLSYIEDSAYDNSIIHRSISGFISQGGGFSFDSENNLIEVTEKGSITNEPVYSNVRGTISMAKIGGQPNSATSQWFINLANNSAELNRQNRGFTAFGQVTEAGMVIMDSIAAVSTTDKDSSLGITLEDIPLENTAGDITKNNAVVIDTIVVTDTTVESAANLEPAINTVDNSSNSSSLSNGAGSLGFLLTTLLASVGLIRRKKTNRPSQTLSSPLQ